MVELLQTANRKRTGSITSQGGLQCDFILLAKFIPPFIKTLDTAATGADPGIGLPVEGLMVKRFYVAAA